MGRLFRNRLAITLLLLLVLIGSAWFYLNRKITLPEIKHVVLISIDTCRADHLSCYGYPKKTTPHLDALAAEGVLFENSYSPAPMTLPAHSTMLTGTIPPFHGVHDNFEYQLSPSSITLAEILKDHSFSTAGVVSSYVLDAMFGMHQGFDAYMDEFAEAGTSSIYEERKGEETSRLAMDWLEQHRDDENLFLFLHYYDPHHDYEPPEPFATEYSENLYAGEIAYTDHCIGEVIEKLKELKLYDSTLIVLAGDHGEMLGEHGEVGHQYFIYQSAIKVPMIFKLPGGQKAKRIQEAAGLVDVAPTICGLLDIASPKSVQGQDLSAVILGGKSEEKDRYIYCESLTPTKYFANPLLGLVGGQWKYIQNTRSQLYDLRKDPGEENNLIQQQPQLARILKSKLDELLMQSVGQGDSDSTIVLDAEALKRLESLGYVGGSVNDSLEIDTLKEDARDTLRFFRMHHNALISISNENYSQAEIICQEMIRERPDFVFPYESLAQIALKQEDYQRAGEYSSKVLNIDNDNAEAHYFLGNALSAQGRQEESLEHYTQALKLRPYDARFYNKLAITLKSFGRMEEIIRIRNEILQEQPDFMFPYDIMSQIAMEQNEYSQAIEFLYKAIELDQNNAAVYYDLGNALSEHGQLDEAVKQYQKAIGLKPDEADYHYGLGEALQLKGNVGEALASYQQSLKLNPDHAESYNNMGLLFQNQGDIQRALEHYKKALELQDDLAEAHSNLGQLLQALARPEQAGSHYRRALEINPVYGEVSYNLGTLLHSQGRIDDAIVHYRKALETMPDHISTHNNLGLALKAKDQMEEAIQHFEQVVEDRPDHVNALINLASILAANPDSHYHDAPRAVMLSQRACQINDYQQPEFLDTLAVAYAATGDLDRAVTTIEEAIKLALTSNKVVLADILRKRLEKYRADRSR